MIGTGKEARQMIRFRSAKILQMFDLQKIRDALSQI